MMSTPATAPPAWAAMNAGAEDGAMPAKLVKAVNQLAAPV